MIPNTTSSCKRKYYASRKVYKAIDFSIKQSCKKEQLRGKFAIQVITNLGHFVAINIKSFSIITRENIDIGDINNRSVVNKTRLL